MKSHNRGRSSGLNTSAKNKSLGARLAKQFAAARLDDEREIEIIPGLTIPLPEATLIARVAQDDPYKVADDLKTRLAFYVRAIFLEGLENNPAVSTFRQLSAQP